MGGSTTREGLCLLAVAFAPASLLVGLPMLSDATMRFLREHTGVAVLVILAVGSLVLGGIRLYQGVRSQRSIARK